MPMKLITELIQEIKPVIEEAVGSGKKSYFIEGPFLQADIKNRNGRIYPLNTLQKEVARYTKELIKENRALGELSHPDSPSINLDRVSHMITKLEQSGKDFNGRAKIMDTPHGKIVQEFLDNGVKLGVSSRGVGSLVDSPEGHVVGEDFYLATAADIVADPSAPAAFVRGVMENKEWVWHNGIICEATVADLKHLLTTAPKKKAEARHLVEAAAFEKFLKAIRVEVIPPAKNRQR